MFVTLDSALQVGKDNVRYTHAESLGPLALAVAAGISLCSVVAVLLAILIDSFRTRHKFVKSQVGAYFLSLAFSDLLQASGSVMNAKWVIIEGVNAGLFCTTQAALKQTGNVGTAIWSLLIAIHTFSLLFLRLRISNSIFYLILSGTWLFIGFIVMMGPFIVQNSTKGPFWGISGYWCWITDAYIVEQFTDEYLFMFITAFASFILYSLIFLRLRGNLVRYGCTFRFQRAMNPWVDNDDNSPIAAVGKQMLWYPVAYTIIILPVAICRWRRIFEHPVSYNAIMTADTIFMLSGFVNAILYSTTRKIVSLRAFLPFSRLLTRRSVTMSSKCSLDDIQFAASALLPDGHQSLNQPEDIFSRREAGYQGSICSEFSQKPYSSMSYDPASPRHCSSQKPTLCLPIMPTTLNHTRIPSQSHPPHHSNPTTPIEVALTPITDSVHSVHRKHFSGWSYPSLRDAQPVHELYGGSDGLCASLEEMRFATPSPPIVPKQAVTQ